MFDLFKIINIKTFFYLDISSIKNCDLICSIINYPCIKRFKRLNRMIYHYFQ